MKILRKILVNWKTSSAGLLAMIASLVAIFYSYNATGAVSEDFLMLKIGLLFFGFGQLLSSIGLINARDIGVSTERENGHPENEDYGERQGN